MGKRGNKDVNKPKGRMSAYAYFVQICREEHKKKCSDEKVTFSEFSKKCSGRWRIMSDKEKKRFHEMADHDKKRFDEEMKHYIPPKGEKGKKRKRTKDPNAPKRSLSAFFFFCNEERPAIKAVHPDYGVGDIAKELGKKWNEVDETTKSKYEAKASKDKLRYEAEMEIYRGGGKKAKPAVVQKEKPKRDSEEDEDEEEEEEEEVDDGDEGEDGEEDEEDDE